MFNKSVSSPASHQEWDARRIGVVRSMAGRGHPRKEGLDIFLYFCNDGNMNCATDTGQVSRLANRLSAMGAEPRLRIMRLLLTAHPQGMVVGEIQQELGIPGSTLSHHLDKLKSEDLVSVRRESQFLRYTANADALRELLAFLYAECCSLSQAVRPDWLIDFNKQETPAVSPGSTKERT